MRGRTLGISLLCVASLLVWSCADSGDEGPGLSLRDAGGDDSSGSCEDGGATGNDVYDPAGEGFGHGGLIYGYSANTTHVPAVGLTYSHMHGAYPAQQWGLISEIHRLFDSPLTELPEPCLPPAHFFDAESVSDRLEIRIRGILNMDGVANPLGAIANATAWLRGLRYPIFGDATMVSILQTVTSERLQVFSFGPARSSAFDGSLVMMNMSVSTLQRETSDDGFMEVAAGSYAFLTVVADVETDGTGRMSRYCIAAVPAGTQSTRISVCDAHEMTWEVGELARFFAEIPLATDEEAIDSYLAPLEFARCNCLIQGDQWGPCEEGQGKRAKTKEPTAPIRDSPPMQMPKWPVGLP